MNDKEMYEASMREAAQDAAFMARTMKCAEDFVHVDSEWLEISREANT